MITTRILDSIVVAPNVVVDSRNWDRALGLICELDFEQACDRVCLSLVL